MRSLNIAALLIATVAVALGTTGCDLKRIVGSSPYADGNYVLLESKGEVYDNNAFIDLNEAPQNGYMQIKGFVHVEGGYTLVTAQIKIGGQSWQNFPNIEGKFKPYIDYSNNHSDSEVDVQIRFRFGYRDQYNAAHTTDFYYANYRLWHNPYHLE